MPELPVNSGATRVISGIQNSADLENRHNVTGTVVYRVGANRPPVTVQVAPNDPGIVVNNIHGLDLSVTNNLPNTLYVVWQ